MIPRSTIIPNVSTMYTIQLGPSGYLYFFDKLKYISEAVCIKGKRKSFPSGRLVMISKCVINHDEMAGVFIDGPLWTNDP